MNPSAQDILRGCVENLEELVAPEISSPHAKSAMMCARMLINHVILRLDQEGAALVEDCREKRRLLATLAEAGEFPPALAAEVRTLAADAEPGHIAMADLTARNDAWKRLFERALAEPLAPAVRTSLRAQLAAQIGREAAYCVPALDGPMF
ncbi:hypothetical protein EEB18_007730 [Sphingopyxis sp. OPL5]|uniref:hypothetical protein n=1 Tax=unclassified Sphingopyxis TaxID=2614943 RepID=UPI0006F7908A|nr:MULTISPECIES: hypothetical protein [unclassified Sphingopyxis]KQZ63864.1 hypothetical protein ASD67_04760 [Sphingopyxis sp. Root1497]QNO28821.1 hypothetical protein EEB18_007730 [Sphingopyxis sp. OPL5]